MADGVLSNPLMEDQNVYDSGQSLSKALGVSYEKLANQQETKDTSAYPTYNASQVSTDVANTAGIKSANSYIDDAKSTVAGQLNTLLSSDSSYIKQAEQKAREDSASKGLLNSSLAYQAGRTAAITAALPIAQQDAKLYGDYGLQQQQAENALAATKTEGIVSGGLESQKAAVAERQQAIQNAFNSRLTGVNEQSKIALQEVQNKHDVGMKMLENQQNLILQQVQLDASKSESIRAQSASIMQNYQVSVENLLTDPDFLDLGVDAMNNAVNQLQTLAKNSIMFIGAASGVNLAPFVNAYLTDLSVI